MALTVPTQVFTINGPFNIGPGINEAIIAISQNASVTSFSVASPFSTLFSASAVAVGSADKTNTSAPCTSTMGSSGQLSLAAGNLVAFNKNSSAQQDFVVTLRGN